MSHDAFVILNFCVCERERERADRAYKLNQKLVCVSSAGFWERVSCDDFGKFPRESSGPGRASESNGPLRIPYTSDRELRVNRK